MRKKYFYKTAAIAFAVILAVIPIEVNAEKSFDTWDVTKASAAVGGKAKKPYTIMVYMNGSDLESEGGMATDDLVEMLESGLDSANAHLVVLTGGSNRWMNDVVPENECMLWEIEDGWFNEVDGIGPANMGNPGTLCSFLRFGMENYPAEQYGLIMWDHGGGAIDGYGYDEKYLDGNLTLTDMGNAFEKAGLAEKKLSFLGFDTCLMATVEMTAVADDYAEVLIASEDLEPGGGWNYDFLNILNDYPGIDGAELGIHAVDRFVEFFGEGTDEIISLSVIDTSKVEPVLESMGALVAPCSESLLWDNQASFRTLAGKRVRTKTFGEGSPRDNESDMVDIGDMASKLSDLYPEEAAAVFSALDDCVIYSRHNSETDLCGLSAYYIYGGRSFGADALETYSALPVSKNYTQYLKNFYNAMINGASVKNRTRSRQKEAAAKIEYALWKPEERAGVYTMAGLKDEPGTGWAFVSGHPVCLFPVSKTETNRHYAIPAKINNRDCDIIVVMSEDNPRGLVEGARNFTGTIIQKGYDPIAPGDKIILYAPELNEKNLSKAEWKELPEFTMKENSLALEWRDAPAGYKTGERVTDLYGEVRYTMPK